MWEWIKESKLFSVVWLAMRVWLGATWLEAGYEKIWGNEAAGFILHNGAGVAGFATHGTASGQSARRCHRGRRSGGHLPRRHGCRGRAHGRRFRRPPAVSGSL